MFTLKILKAKVRQLKETVLEVESMLEDYENEKINQKETIFYERLKLPANANVLQFFDKLEVSLAVKTGLIELYKEDHPESFQKFEKNPVPLPREMRAFNGFIWLKKFNPYEVLRFKNVGIRATNNLIGCIQKLDTMLVE